MSSDDSRSQQPRLTVESVDKINHVSSLIPVHASEHVLGGVSEYLATAFSLANPETSNALKAFLEDTERGMFYGPYARVRLPYARAIGWDGILDWMPSWFTPYPPPSGGVPQAA